MTMGKERKESDYKTVQTSTTIVKWKKEKAKEMGLNISEVLDSTLDIIFDCNESEWELRQKLEANTLKRDQLDRKIATIQAELQGKRNNKNNKEANKANVWREIWRHALNGVLPEGDVSEIMGYSERELLDIIDNLKLHGIDRVKAQDWSYVQTWYKENMQEEL